MLTNLDGQKRDINQFHFITNHTITELYRADSYIEELKGIIKQLNNLINLHERMVKADFYIKKRKAYTKLINNISAELQYLKATNEAMEDNLDEIKRTELIQYNISGEIMDLKMQINKATEKAEKILRENASH